MRHPYEEVKMKYLVTFACLVLACCLFCGFMPTDDDRIIYENTVRLHVLANSDSEHDQSVKLAVRDAVLEEMQEILANAENHEDAVSVITENLDRIREVCNETLEALGEELTATVILSEENYPTRHYETMSLPAGTYQSLRIQIGAAEGKNWWCVLYPALCTNVAKTEESLIKTGFSPEQIEILTDGESPKYKIKFKFLEIFGEAFS